MRKLLFFALMITLTSSFLGCSSKSEGSAKLDYKETKSMVLDILHTKEGKKVISDVVKDPSVNQQMMLSDVKMQQTLEKTLITPENQKFMQELMKDPKFAGEFAKAIKEQNKKLQKDLMKDPEYQQQMMQLFKNPEMEKMMLDLLKSKAYRQQAMTTMKESLDSPLFKLEMMELMQKAMEENTKPKKKSNSGGGGGSGGGGSK